MLRLKTGGLAALLLASVALPAAAQTDRERLRLMEKTIQDLLKRDEAREQRVKELEGEVARLRGRRLPAAAKKKDEPAHGHDHRHGPGHSHDHAAPGQPASPGRDAATGHDHAEHDDSVWSAPIGDGTLRLNRIGIDADAALGWTTTNQANVERLFAGGHDPRQNGFTLRAVELSLSGSYDPYFDAFVNVVYLLTPEGESKIELEEAWIQSKRLFGFATLKAGLFLTPFGVTNAMHQHEWDFQTQPIINSRLFGEDGHRGVGLQAKLDLPLPWRSHLILGAQNARGETQASFLANDEVYDERPIGGYTFRDAEINGLSRLVFFARFANSLALAPDTFLQLGASGMIGPNATGSNARTYIWGADATLTLGLGKSGRLRWSTEVAQRIFHAREQEIDDGAGGVTVLPKKTLTDFGLATALLWDIDAKWTVGARYEFATSRGDSVNTFASNGADPFRGNRHRISPIAIWNFSKLGRLSFQYNYDHAQFLTAPERRSVHSAFLNVHWKFGLGTNTHAGHDH